MNYEMIEPKVTAIMNELVTTKKQYQIDSMSGNFYSQNDIVDVLRSALATLPEPAPVSVEEIVEAVRNKFHMIWTYQEFDSYLPMIKDAVKQVLNNSKTINHDERG